MKYHYLNYSLEDLKEEIDDIVYKEKWKSINGFKDSYQVSSFGRIKSIPRKVKNNGGFYISKCRIRRQVVMKNGYLTVGLNMNKKGLSVTKFVHILVAVAFIPNPLKKKTVHHFYDDKKDNRVIRLRWLTHAEQIEDARMKQINPQIGETHHWSKLTEKQVIFILKSKLSVNELSFKFSISKQNIRAIIRRATWRYLDYNNSL